jgi:hypothetical protein
MFDDFERDGVTALNEFRQVLRTSGNVRIPFLHGRAADPIFFEVPMICGAILRIHRSLTWRV